MSTTARARASSQIVRWLWVASGVVDFQPFDRAIRQLDQAGITFVGKQVLAKHLPAAAQKSKPTQKAR